MQATAMPRKDAKFRLDDRVLNALRIHAEAGTTSFNALVESILLNYAKGTGLLPVETEPLPDRRGGQPGNKGNRKIREKDSDPTAVESESLERGD